MLCAPDVVDYWVRPGCRRGARRPSVEGMSSTRSRWPGWVYGVGDEPDPRFSLANERTFLAWVRTSLGLVAGAVVLDLLPRDQEVGLLVDRCKALGMDLQPLMDAGRLKIQQTDAAELSPGEFTANVRACVECEGILTVVIDSLNGYQAAMPEEHFLLLHMHE